jgi:hypothetical protein
MFTKLLLKHLPIAPRDIRGIGLVGDAVALWSHARRRRKDWAEHEARCHAIVGRAMKKLSAYRTALVLGSGMCLDVPVREMAGRFERVVLVDAFHMPSVKRALADVANITFETMDLTGCAAWVLGRADGRSDPLARHIADPRIDLVVSANVLSQLPLAPENWLEGHKKRAAALPPDLLARIVAWHLDDLRRFRGRVVLLTDVEMTERDQSGRVTETVDLLCGQTLPKPDETWVWPVAPFGEYERDREYIHRVVAYADFNDIGKRADRFMARTHEVPR